MRLPSGSGVPDAERSGGLTGELLARLLERAAALCDHPPTHLLIDLARTFDDPSAAASLLDEVAERARTEGDTASAALAEALASYHRTHLTEGSADEQERLALARDTAA